MSNTIQELGTPAMFEAMEANFIEEMACFGRGLPGAKLYCTSEICYLITGRPHLNGILYARFAQNDPAYLDAKIDEIVRRFEAHGVVANWVIGASTRHTNLATHLEAHGFSKRADEPAMAADLLAINEHIQTAPGLVIKEVEDLAALEISRTINAQGWENEGSAENYAENYANLGFGDDHPWHHYIGWLDNQPVTAASLLLYAGIAGIYGVITIPEARRRGAGGAITLHALLEARKRGYRVAIL